MKEHDDPVAAGFKRVNDAHDALKGFRASIDNIDAALIHMLAERFRCTQAVGVLKATHGLPPADPARESQQIARLRQLAQDANLDPDFAEKFLNFVIKEVIRHHEQIAAGNGATAPGAEGASTNG
ncbi:chorismate mutase [Mesorhizobium sp. CN2-181]|uniref:chorismate mutase n=1 Tax=Mesorhizobium yinganensis TaxID=3157707 RepID=UPI0032B74633